MCMDRFIFVHPGTNTFVNNPKDYFPHESFGFFVYILYIDSPLSVWLNVRLDIEYMPENTF